MIVKDSSDQPVLNCSSLLEVKIFLNENSEAKIEQPSVTDDGKGCYKFSASHSANSSVQNIQLKYKHTQRQQKYTQQQQKYGLVSVQVFGKDIQGSPLR